MFPKWSPDTFWISGFTVNLRISDKITKPTVPFDAVQLVVDMACR